MLPLQQDGTSVSSEGSDCDMCVGSYGATELADVSKTNNLKELLQVSVAVLLVALRGNDTTLIIPDLKVGSPTMEVDQISKSADEIIFRLEKHRLYHAWQVVFRHTS